MIPAWALAAGEFGVNFIKGLFGSGEDERKRRHEQLIAEYNQAHANAIQRQHIASAGRIGQARQAAAERAAALGRTGDAEAFILPAEQQAEDIGSREMADINTMYDRERLAIEQQFADRPIEPGPLDYLGEGIASFAELQSGEQMVKTAEGEQPLPQAKIEIPTEEQRPTVPEPQPVEGAPVAGQSSLTSALESPDLEKSTARRYASTYKRRKKLNAGFEEPYNSMVE